MADSIVVLRQRTCRGEGCGALFFICRSCGRGQGYCSRSCRRLQRRLQCRAADRRHQQSPEGRADHRDRQRAYRQRQQQARVTDQRRQRYRSSFRLWETLAACSKPRRSVRRTRRSEHQFDHLARDRVGKVDLPPVGDMVLDVRLENQRFMLEVRVVASPRNLDASPGIVIQTDFPCRVGGQVNDSWRRIRAADGDKCQEAGEKRRRAA